MTSLLTVLIALWVVMTIALVVVWIDRRRKRSVEESPFEAPPAVSIGELTDADDEDSRPEGREDEADGEDGIITDELDDNDDNDIDDSDNGDGDKEVIMAIDPEPTRTDDWFKAPETENGDNVADDQIRREGDDDRDAGSVTTRSLSDILDGIRLPYDLTPIPSAVEDPERHLIFLTTHSNAEEVGTKFADELVRVGFEFEPVGFDQAIAVREDDVVSMTIVPRAGEVENGNGPRYGAADVSDVALEVWIGRSTSPPVVTG